MVRLPVEGSVSSSLDVCRPRSPRLGSVAMPFLVRGRCARSFGERHRPDRSQSVSNSLRTISGDERRERRNQIGSGDFTLCHGRPTGRRVGNTAHWAV